MSTPRLWTFALSPFAGKARAAFAEKGAEVELVEIDAVNRPPRMRELNPTSRVPVLEVGGYAIRESWVICEWVDETYPDPPLWPADPALRGWARGWGRYVDDAPVTSFFLGLRKQKYGLDPGDPEDVVERMHARIARHWATIDAQLGVHDGPWLCGEQFTLADLSGLAVAVRLPQLAPHLQPDEDELPLCAGWLQAMRERPSAVAITARGVNEPLTA